METVGIDSIKSIMSLGLAIIVDTQESLEDGKLTVTDIMNYKDTLAAIVPAIQGIGEVKAELKDLSNAELLEIKEFVVSKLPGIGDKWVQVAEHAIMAGHHIWAGYKAATA